MLDGVLTRDNQFFELTIFAAEIIDVAGVGCTGAIPEVSYFVTCPS